MSRLFLSLCLLSILICFVPETVAYEAIINGIKADVDKFSYQVSLQYVNNYPFCGGGIIHKQFVLTAAHCVIPDGKNFEKRRLFVLAGTNDLSKRHKPAMSVEIHKIFVPTVYNPAKDPKFADIAVVKLKHPLELSRHIRELRLPDHKDETYVDKRAEFAGFGWNWVIVENNKPNGDRNDTHLRYVIADILGFSQDGSTRTYVPPHLVYAKAIQGAHSKPRGVCLGDSGGPLVHGETVIGILSQTPFMCSEVEMGALYVSVAHYLDFIKTALEENVHHKDIRAHVMDHQ